MQDSVEQLFQQLFVRCGAVVDSLRTCVCIPDLSNQLEHLHGGIVLQPDQVVLRLETASKSQGDHESSLGTVLGVIANHQVGEVVEEDGQGGLNGIALGVLREVAGDAVCLQDVFRRNGSEQLEIVIVLADSDVAFDEFRGDSFWGGLRH